MRRWRQRWIGTDAAGQGGGRGMRGRRAVAIACLALGWASASGCAGTRARGAIRLYEPLAVTVRADRDALVAHAEGVVLSLGGVVISTDNHRLVAVLRGDDYRIRDRVILDVGERGDVTIDVRTEIERSDGEWMLSDAVCRNYSYSRERELAAAIGAGEAARGAPVVVALAHLPADAEGAPGEPRPLDDDADGPDRLR